MRVPPATRTLITSVPDQAVVRELIVVPTRQSAMAAGFRGAEMRHPCLMMRDARVHWPGRGVELLRGVRFDRIFVDSSVTRDPSSPWRFRDRDIIMAWCTHPNTVWIEP